MIAIAKIWQQITTISVDPSKIFTDFVAFAASFGFISYAGGFVYLRSFFNEFSLTLPNYWDVPMASTTFLTSVVLRDWATVLLFLVAVLFSSFIYFIVRHVFTNWVGYTIICLSGSFGIIIAVAIGAKLGSEEGRSAWNSSSAYPRVTLAAVPDNDYSPEFIEYAKNGALKLLYHDSEHYYLFLPKSYDDIESIQPIFIVNRQDFFELRLAR